MLSQDDLYTTTLIDQTLREHLPEQKFEI